MSDPTQKFLISEINFYDQITELQTTVTNLQSELVILRSRVIELEEWKARKESEELFDD